MNQSNSKTWLQAMQLGQRHLQQGQLADATKHYVSATQIEPARAEGWINLGIAQAQMKQLDQALASLNQAVRLKPSIMPAHLAIGDVHRLLGNEQESINAYQRAVALERAPTSLNKLACSLRTIGKAAESEALYQDALRIDPDFTLAQTNLATVQIELQRFDAAREQLNAMKGLPLSPMEENEIGSTRVTLDEYFRIQPSVEAAAQDGNLEPLYKTLCATPSALLQVDEEVFEGIRHYADSARSLAPLPEIESPGLPEDWPLIEALFMIPFVESVSEYRKVKDSITKENNPSGDLLESLIMEAVVRDTYATFGEMQEPIKAETYLRYWHLLATRGIADIVPGQFKMTRNQTRADLAKRRAEPHLAAGTFRRFISDIYAELPAGLPRGLVTIMAISDIHAFADGNGRLAMTWLNRELESTGQFPALFTRELGACGKRSDAMRKVRRSGGDLSFLVPVIIEAQQFARDFCVELAQSRSTSKKS